MRVHIAAQIAGPQICSEQEKQKYLFLLRRSSYGVCMFILYDAFGANVLNIFFRKSMVLLLFIYYYSEYFFFIGIYLKISNAFENNLIYDCIRQRSKLTVAIKTGLLWKNSNGAVHGWHRRA